MSAQQRELRQLPAQRQAVVELRDAAAAPCVCSLGVGQRHSGEIPKEPQGTTQPRPWWSGEISGKVLVQTKPAAPEVAAAASHSTKQQLTSQIPGARHGGGMQTGFMNPPKAPLRCGKAQRVAKDIQHCSALGYCLICWSPETDLSHQNTEVNNKTHPHACHGKKIPLELFSMKLWRSLAR